MSPASVRRRHRSFFARVGIALVVLLGTGFFAVQTLGANAAVNQGGNFSDDDLTAVAFWAAEGWPTAPGKKQIVHQETRHISGGGTATAFRNYGRYGDRDGQLTAWITANLTNSVTPMFGEYDYNFRAPQNTPRDAMRIVRDYANGVVFITRDHYANFEVFGIGDDTEIVAPSLDENMNQGTSEEADLDGGDVEQPPANEADSCASPTPEACPAGIAGQHLQVDPLDQELINRYDNMMNDMPRLSAYWAALLVAFVIVTP